MKTQTLPMLLVGVMLLHAPAPGLACEATKMATTPGGFMHKVVAGSDRIKVFAAPGSTAEVYVMELLQPYFVICEDDDFLKITDVPTETVEEAMTGKVGYVLKAQTRLWPTREALAFSKVAFMEDRPELVAWGDEYALKKFLETGDKETNPPAFKENLEATRRRERATRPYPVLSSANYRLRGVAEKRAYHVLLPVAIKPTEAWIDIKEQDLETARKALTSVTIVLVFDATAAMGPFAVETANAIVDAVRSLPREVVENSRMGFVFYRDAMDDEKLVAVPPIPVEEAARSLKEAAALMDGGGDAEPILDAIYFAAHIYDWGQGKGGGRQTEGKRILIGVLNEDAHPLTIGTLDEQGRIPKDLDAVAVAKELYDQSMAMVTVQAGPVSGPNLVPVLQTLADKTGGTFIKWDARATTRSIALQLSKLMAASADASIKKGKETLKEMKFDLTGYASIPLEVIDGELLERLRRNGVAFNIAPGEGGVLVREGYIIENADLLAPEIQIEKDTLQGLIRLYSVLGTTGLDSETFRQSAREAIAAIAGEDFDERDTIAGIIRKKAGIEFRSGLLNFDLGYLDALAPAERLRLTKRIQDAGERLTMYLEGNLKEFDSNPAVWMPVTALP